MIISWNVTKRCNLECRHCYRDAGQKAVGELTPEEGRRLVGEIAAAGFRILVLSGGEPLLREDIYDLISLAAAKGMRPVLGTNGTLIDRAVARELRQAGLARAGISVDSLDPLEHDLFRGLVGAWESTMAAIEACRAEGLPFQLHTTVTARNAARLAAVTDFAERSGAAAHHVFFLVPTGRGEEIGGSVLKRKEYHALVGMLARRQRSCSIELKAVCAPQFVPYCREHGIESRFKKGCLAGISYCCILPDGELHPCPYLPLRAGSVREKPFDELWKESALFAALRTQRYKGSCGACRWRTECGGCRARAFHRYGDCMHEDPSCLRTGKENHNALFA